MDSHQVVVFAGVGSAARALGASPVTPLDLMAEAIERAVSDSGASSLIDSVDQILVPQGSWQHPNAAADLGARFGLSPSTVRSELGVLQTTLIARAVADVAAGRSLCSIVVGGEARASAREFDPGAAIEPDTFPAPDVVLAPTTIPISRLEIDSGLVQAVQHYAMIENAYAADHGRGVVEHRQAIDAEWRAMAMIADQSPDAWVSNATARIDRDGWGRPLASPYCSNHVTQWNVDQAAAVIVCSAEVAASVGSPRDRWTYPEAVIESNHMVPVTQRPNIGACVGFDVVAEHIAASTATPAADRQVVELYSCFPVAVRLQQEALGLVGTAPSVLGGMSFGGGPYNNFVLQSLVAVAQRVRAESTTGLVTAVSGMLTKQGAITLRPTPPDGPVSIVDCSEEVANRQPAHDEVAPVAGEATVRSSTVIFDREGPERVAAIVEYDDGTRTIAQSRDDEVIAAFGSPRVGSRVNLHADDDGKVALHQ